MRKFSKTKLLLIAGIVEIGILAGCGNKEDNSVVPQVEPVEQLETSANTENDEESDGDTESSREQENQPEDARKQENDSESDTTELDGRVMSIGKSSVTVSKIFIGPSDFGTGEVMIVGVGGDNQELIKVYFEEDASYVYETIRNGGKDVETRQGSFSDITEGVTLHMMGRYEGEDFWADHVDISYVVLSDAW